MSEDNKPAMSRRAYLAASATGAAFIAGCASQDDSTTAEPAAEDTETTESDTMTETEPEEEDEDEMDLDPSSVGESVLVNQVGYRPDDEKVAVVRTDAESFAVFDAESGESVAEGDLSDPVEDENSGDTVRHAEFSDVSEPGEYVLAVGEGDVASYEFSIGEGVWGETLAEVGRAYTLKRSNTDITDSVTGLDVGPGHPQDAEAEMYFSDEFHDEGDALDMTGGWYDAGDYGKYIPPANVAVSQLLLAYEQNPETFEAGQFAFPDGISGDDEMPDLLSEVKFELEWMEKMQREDGAVYHKVSGANWPGMDVAPTEDEQTRYVFGFSTYGTAGYAGTMTMAARIYEEFDEDLAERFQGNAEAAWGYLQANPDPIFHEDEGQNSGSGRYGKESDAEERMWAAAELLKTTGDGSYDEYLRDEHSDLLVDWPWPVEWNNAKMLGQWAYASADAADGDKRSEVRDVIVNYADDLVSHIESEGYNISLTEDQYYWSSNKVAAAKGNILLMANEITEKAEYVTKAQDQIHYLLGRSPTAYSYVTGVGDNPTQNSHDRIRVSTGTYVPGYLVGGPNADGGGPEIDPYIEENDPAPAKCYLDRTESYATNEWAIDYSAPLFFALAHFTPADAVSPE